MTPVNYMDAVDNAALSALRAKGSDKIVAAIRIELTNYTTSTNIY